MKRFTILPIVLFGVLGPSANMGRSNPPTTKQNHARLPGVPALLKARFERVPGEASKQSVVDTGPPGRWNSAYVASPTVDFDGTSYRMWFVGGTATQDPDVPYGHLDRIGLAESADGRRWIPANGGKPVLDLGPAGSPDAKGLAHPYVLRVGKRYMMWYAAIDGAQARDLGLAPAHVRIERICLATSDDGIHWTRENGGQPVLDIGRKGSVDSIQAGAMHVLRVGEQFMMWYSAYNGRHALAVANSPDGVHWTRANDGKPIEGLVGGNQGQTGPSVYYDGHRFFLLYCSDKGGEWKMYAAVSDDGVHFQHVHDGHPVLGPPPPGSFGTAGVGRNHSVHPSQMYFDGRRARVWYSAEDGSPPHLQRIGLMEAVIPPAKAAKPATDGDRKLTSAERTVVARGAAWGVITTLADGSLGLVIQRARPLKDISAVNVCMEWMRSTDGGRSWSQPVLLAERRGRDGKLYERRPDGGSIVFQQRNQALGQLSTGRIVCAFCELNYHYDQNGEAEPRPGVAWNHENQGISYCWSDDLGRTWSRTRKVSPSPFGGQSPMITPHWRIITLPDGTAVMSVYGTYDPEYKGPLNIPEGTRVMAGVLRSSDQAETWGDPSVIMAKPDTLPWEETALCLTGDTLLAHVRTGRHNVVQYVSSDYGRTWEGPTQVTEPGQQPGGAFRLSSGRLLFTWGNRRAPFGAAAMLGTDDGQTWDYAHRVSLAWDAPNANCGYANGAQAGDGTIVVVYYRMPVTQDYRQLWGGSEVYAVRFTEDQFLKAARD